MKQLPQNNVLPVQKLVGCFNNTSATYKFYWLLAIVQEAELGHTMIAKKKVFAGMVSNAWYTINYFNVSFGSQDKLQQKIKNIIAIEHIPIDARKEVITEWLLNSKNKYTLQELAYFNNQVPHWFLSPWFPGEKSVATIYKQSHEFHNLCPYALDKDFITLNILWANYFRENAALIKDFCYWNLALYLQGRNPNVPDIPNKLIKPGLRNNLNKQKRLFWDIVIAESGGSIQCIYKDRPLVIGDYAIEHFIPYSFVSHDLIWNLIPADKSFNCTKSNRLPQLNKYFDSFYLMQKNAVKIIKRLQPRNKFLEDYLSIFSNLDDVDADFTKQKFKERIEPLITIAANNGFEYMNPNE